MKFGRHLRAKRLERGFTLRRFCRANAGDAGNLSRIERSLVLPSAHMAGYLMRVYGFEQDTQDYEAAQEAYLAEVRKHAKAELK